MNSYFISYEWDIAIISALVTLLVITILMQLSMLLSEWWFVKGKNKKSKLIDNLKQKFFYLLVDMNEKFNLGLYLAQKDFMFIRYPYINRIEFKLPDNPRYNTMECILYLSDSPKGTNPAEEDTIRMYLYLKTYEWDTFRDKLEEKYEEVKTLYN